MSSAICFNLNQSKILLSGNELISLAFPLVLTQISFQVIDYFSGIHQRFEKTKMWSERMFVSTQYQTCNHQITSQMHKVPWAPQGWLSSEPGRLLTWWL